MDPHASWMLVRGMKTLAVRVARQNENALRVAEFLEQHAKVRRVHYPFLKSHPQQALARAQMSGGGGMVTFEVDGTGEDARRVSEALRLFTLAPSLGGVESLVCIPVLTSHLSVPEEERRKMGVTEQMIRLSVGIENAHDLVADLENALESRRCGDCGERGVVFPLRPSAQLFAGLNPQSIRNGRLRIEVPPGCARKVFEVRGLQAKSWIHCT